MTQVSIFGVRGRLITPTGTSLNFSVRHCYDFGISEGYYVRTLLEAESGESVSSKVEFRLLASALEDTELIFASNVRILTQSFRQQGVEETSRQILECGLRTSHIHGTMNGC